MEYKLSLLLI